MKKTFGISLVAALVMSPMMANAVEVAGDPGAKQTNLTTEQAAAITAGAAPKYALKQADGDDGAAATAGYVKGAYNALIKGINKTQDEVDTLNTGIGTYRNTVDHLLDGKATKTGTVATIKSATTNESIATSSVNINGLTTTSISAKASGNVNLSMPIVDDWANDSLAANPIQTTTTFTNLTVNGLSMSAPGTNNTAQLTKTGIIGDVDVVEYIAQSAAAHYDYTPLIRAKGDSYGYKSADGNGSENADGLELGEWKVTWNSYGTAKGTSMCSADWDGYSYGNTISGTPASITDPDAEAGCWCKLTSFTEKDDGPTHNDNSLWVFSTSSSSASDCARYCADSCGYDVRFSSDTRSGLFGSVAQ